MWLFASMQYARSGSLLERFGSQRCVVALGMMM